MSGRKTPAHDLGAAEAGTLRASTTFAERPKSRFFANTSDTNRLNLEKPRHIDRSTGYRLYEASQLADLHFTPWRPSRA